MQRRPDSDISAELLGGDDEEKDSRQYKDVEITMLRTDWIYNGSDMGDLIIAMSEADTELFKTDLFHVLIGGFWNFYFLKIIMVGFLPWTINSGLTLYYLSNFLHVNEE